MIRGFVKHAILPLVVCLGSLTPALAATHTHCATEPWSNTSSELDASQPLPLTFLDGGEDAEVYLFFKPFPVPGPTKGTKTCEYEVTDLQSLEITLTFSGATNLTFDTSVWNTTDVFSTGMGPSLSTSFASGSTKTFAFEAHDGENTDNPDLTGPFVFTAPTAFEFQLFEPSAPNRITLTDAKIKASGVHYYIPSPIPVPASAFLLVAAFATFAAMPKTRRKS